MIELADKLKVEYERLTVAQLKQRLVPLDEKIIEQIMNETDESIEEVEETEDKEVVESDEDDDEDTIADEEEFNLLMKKGQREKVKKVVESDDDDDDDDDDEDTIDEEEFNLLMKKAQREKKVKKVVVEETIEEVEDTEDEDKEMVESDEYVTEDEDDDDDDDDDDEDAVDEEELNDNEDTVDEEKLEKPSKNDGISENFDDDVTKEQFQKFQEKLKNTDQYNVEGNIEELNDKVDVLAESLGMDEPLVEKILTNYDALKTKFERKKLKKVSDATNLKDL